MTREIAEVAGVAEGMIHRHFTDKRELFCTALAAAGPQVLQELVGLTDLAGQGDVRDNLAKFVAALEEIERDLASLQASVWSDTELTQGLSFSTPLQAAGPELALKPLIAYLLAEQRLGRIRADVDCERAAFALFAVPFASVVMGRMSPGGVGARDSGLM